MSIYSCDLETNNHGDNCHVWAAGAYDIETENHWEWDSLEGLFTMFEGGGTFYFHNLKFDGGFILDEILRRKMTWVKLAKIEKGGYAKRGERYKLRVGEFTTIISDTHVFYQIQLNISGNVATIFDSLKVIPAAVKQIPKMFGLEETKGEIDYNLNRPKGYKMTAAECNYLQRDCAIVGKALRMLFDQGLTSMTTAANAFKFYREMIGEEDYARFFPPPLYDKEIRQAYKGGYCIVHPDHVLSDIGKLSVFDKNSMYPWVMRTKPLPFGEGVYFRGRYKRDELYPLYIYSFRCQFELKKGHLPTIQIKNTRSGFMPTEYLKSSKGEEVVLTLTNVDYELFKKHYHVYFEEPIGGYKFMATTQLFRSYIDYWYEVKERATVEGNAVMRTIAKLMLNSLYGKFGARTIRKQAIPYLDEDGVVRFEVSDEEEIEGKYLPVACFITAYAREDIITLGQKYYDRLLYIDTDSLHLIGHEIPEGLDVDNYRLGAWKQEGKFKRGRYIRAKRYLEVKLGKYKRKSNDVPLHGKYERKGKAFYRWKEYLDVKCCGLPASCHNQVTWENFHPGMIYTGKLQHHTVQGGVILRETIFTLK